MKIVTVPHPSLRKVAQTVSTVDKQLVRFVNELDKTLAATTKPKGVGLAGPQVDVLKRVFTTRVEKPLVFINPEITAHSTDMTLGPDENEPVLEGCLSIPHLYGPVPRWSWVEVEFQVLKTTRGEHTLVEQKGRFEDFYARVIQHELDHLNGVLFIDHSLEYDLPVYQEDDKSKKAEEVERSFLEMF